MKASELRIGNSIMQDDDLVFVTWWRLELMENNKIEYKPILIEDDNIDTNDKNVDFIKKLLTTLIVKELKIIMSGQMVILVLLERIKI